MMKKTTWLKIAVPVAILAGLVAFGSRWLTPVKMIARQAERYFSAPSASQQTMHELGTDLYAYQDHMETSFVVRTEDHAALRLP